MNIFATSYYPQEAARWLDDRRLLKMILESSQLLANALYRANLARLAPLRKDGSPYPCAFLDHPCSRWVSESRENYGWLLQHAQQMVLEYRARFGKVHCMDEQLARMTDRDIRGHLPAVHKTPFANCTPFKDQPAITAYRFALAQKWKKAEHRPRWTNAEEPKWRSEAESLSTKLLETRKEFA